MTVSCARRVQVRIMYREYRTNDERCHDWCWDEPIGGVTSRGRLVQHPPKNPCRLTFCRRFIPEQVLFQLDLVGSLCEDGVGCTTGRHG